MNHIERGNRPQADAPPHCPPTPGYCYDGIAAVYPRRTADGEWRYDVELAGAGEPHTADLSAAEITTYGAARKAIAARYGAWLAIDWIEARQTVQRWSETIADAMCPPREEAGA